MPWCLIYASTPEQPLMTEHTFVRDHAFDVVR